MKHIFIKRKSRSCLVQEKLLHQVMVVYEVVILKHLLCHRIIAPILRTPIHLFHIRHALTVSVAWKTGGGVLKAISLLGYAADTQLRSCGKSVWHHCESSLCGTGYGSGGIPAFCHQFDTSQSEASTTTAVGGRPKYFGMSCELCNMIC